MNRNARMFVLAGLAALSAAAAGASETVTYTYDARGRLTKVVRAGGPDGNYEASYSLDGADNRTNVTVNLYQVITGTSGDDVLQGGAGGDQLGGLAGEDRLYGLDGNDYLIGGSGHDQLYGGNGNDTLEGSDHNDLLDGGPGADTMTGGGGHDTYVVDNSGDVVIEAGLGGTDIVQSSITFALPTHFERLELTGTFSINGSGNSGDNRLTGNGGNNQLNGGSGDDEVLGGSGNDRLYGSGGDDQLTGGAGDDHFVFNAAPGSGNVDAIVDYVVADDSILIANYAFTAIGPTGTLASTKFHAGTAAANASHRILYDSATGTLRYDADGTDSTAAVIFATVTPGTALTSAEFQVYD